MTKYYLFLGELFQKFAYCCCCFWFFNFSCKAEDVAPRSVLDEQLSHLVIWVQEKGKRGNAFCVMRTKKKDQYPFLQNCTRKLMRDPTVFFQHFPLLDFTHYNHHISRNTERGCDPSLWFLTSTPLPRYFTQALSELKCWARGHFPSTHHHGVFIYYKCKAICTHTEMPVSLSFDWIFFVIIFNTYDKRA